MATHHKDDCPCGSGKRYKHCHLQIDQARRRKARVAGLVLVGAVLLGVAAFGAIGGWPGGKKNASLAGADSSATRALATTGGAVGGGGDVGGTRAPTPSSVFGIVQPGLTGRPPIPQSNVGTTIPIGAGKGGLAPGENPMPWEYDIAKNRHYDPRPGHQHWHNGPPPADTTQAVVIAPRQIKLDAKGNVISETASRVAGSGTVAATGSAAGGWAGGHQPLAPGENPKPWEYDKAKDRHFDPTHGHWHAGKPPAGK